MGAHGGKDASAVATKKGQAVTSQRLSNDSTQRIDAGAAKERVLGHDDELKVVDGKIPLPDVRVQYETGTAERAWLGLEYVSVHYGGGELEWKTAAEFQLYGGGDFSGSSASVAAPKLQTRGRSLAEKLQL